MNITPQELAALDQGVDEHLASDRVYLATLLGELDEIEDLIPWWRAIKAHEALAILRKRIAADLRALEQIAEETP